MVNSVGKQLQQARVAKQLSVEEAARVTRIRPDKLLDLEEDNYSNFPSMSYAKGFLLLYARFLDVDVRDFAETLHAPNPVSSDDYEYLSAAASGPQPQPTRRAYHPAPRRERTILPVLVFGLLAGAIVLAIYLIVSFQRLGNLEDVTEKKDASSPAASPAISTLPTPEPVAAATPTAPPVVRNPPPALVAATPAPTPVAAESPMTTPPPTAAAESPTAMPSPVPAAAFDPTREVRRAEPVFPTPPGHADASPNGTNATAALPPVGAGPGVSAIVPMASALPSASPDALKQVTILPVRKTLVTIRRDVEDSAPIFEDWLYPGDGPLKLRGHKFWIQVQDPGAVQISQDGQPLQGDQHDIQIE